MSDTTDQQETSGEGAPDSGRLFSGIQPTGTVHVGNYLGAIRNWVALQERYECIYCIVDHHATTVTYDPRRMSDDVFEIAVALLASGIDPERSRLYVQSMVPEHAELAWNLGTVAMYGELQRMTQFKDKTAQHEANVNVGLFTYPVLQAADILLYRAGVVPIGEDQQQHLELSRDLARRWNNRYGEGFFPQPKALFTPARRILGLDGQEKMSKSRDNFIGLLEDPETRWQKLRGAYTDPQRLRLKDPGRPEVCNVHTLHTFFSSDERVAEVQTGCRGATLGCVQCKRWLDESIETTLGPIREASERWRERPDRVWEVLREGGRTSRREARATMSAVRGRMGLPGPVDEGDLGEEVPGAGEAASAAGSDGDAADAS